LALALAGNCVPFWLISFGLQRIDSGLAGILMGIMPLTTMVLAHFFVPGERLNTTKAIGFMVGFGGLVMLIGPAALAELRGEGRSSCISWRFWAARSATPSTPLSRVTGRRPTRWSPPRA
jgi:drug/metabolite transporter (DMT)-like permease